MESFATHIAGIQGRKLNSYITKVNHVLPPLGVCKLSVRSQEYFQSELF